MMENELKFKTNINCGGCVAKVTPLLNEIRGIEWEVDTASPDKVLIIKGNNVAADMISETIGKVGFKAEQIF